MIPINDIFDFLIVAGVLTLAVLAAVARTRIFRSDEGVKIRPSDWLLFSDSPPSLREVAPTDTSRHYPTSPRRGIHLWHILRQQSRFNGR